MSKGVRAVTSPMVRLTANGTELHIVVAQRRAELEQLILEGADEALFVTET